MNKPFLVFAILYIIAPLLVIPTLAYVGKDGYLLLGLVFSYLGSASVLNKRYRLFVPLFLVLCLVFWSIAGFSFHQHTTFFFICALWGTVMARIAGAYDDLVKNGQRSTVPKRLRIE